MKFALAFSVFGATVGLMALLAETMAERVILTSVAIAFLGVALAYSGVGARIFRKRRDGRLPPATYVLFWPYFALNHLLLLGYRLFTRENAFDEVADGVVLGARLYARDEAALAKHGLSGVLDLTCEFSEIAFLRRTQRYLCIPLLDTKAPTAVDLERGVAWLQREMSDGTVYVHCAMGHGRSATFVAALLVTLERVADATEAEALICERRPRAGLTAVQRTALAEFVTARSV